MIYAISDIHGCLDEFEEALAGVDLSEVGSRLVLLGECCDRGQGLLRHLPFSLLLRNPR